MSIPALTPMQATFTHRRLIRHASGNTVYRLCERCKCGRKVQGPTEQKEISMNRLAIVHTNNGRETHRICSHHVSGNAVCNPCEGWRERLKGKGPTEREEVFALLKCDCWADQAPIGTNFGVYWAVIRQR
jgi:hypothetical protein